jgi:hypothetical protein
MLHCAYHFTPPLTFDPPGEQPWQFSRGCSVWGGNYGILCDMSEPKPTWIETTENLAEQHSGLMTRLNNHGRKATRQEALMAKLAAKPVEDPVAAVQAVARLEGRA